MNILAQQVPEQVTRTCKETIKNNSRSFYWASRLFPKHLGNDAVALYAWCRRADDAIDDSLPEHRPAALDRLRAEVQSVYNGTPQTDSALIAFADVVSRRQIPMEYPLELLLGMEMDVVGTTYRTFDELLLYCHRVAGVVGLMMSHVMGVKSEKALVSAAHLGIAMQLTNICRDVAEDWYLGRIYIPKDVLTEKDPGKDVFPQSMSPKRIGSAELARATPPSVKHLLIEAQDFYQKGRRGLPALSWRCRWAVDAAQRIYSDIGRVLAKQGFNPMVGRAIVPGWRKFLLVTRATASMLRFNFGRPHIPSTTLTFPDDILSR